MPLLLLLRLLIVRAEPLFRIGQLGELLLQRVACVAIQQRHRSRLAAQQIQLGFCLFVALVDGGGNQTVNFGAGQLLKQFRALTGFGVEKGGELAL